MADERSLVFRPLGFNGRTLPADHDEPLRHVIDEYQHRPQLVTCVCGWHGSSASDRGGRSPWDAHKANYRIARPARAERPS